jgi:P22_AR N-terminal domain
MGELTHVEFHGELLDTYIGIDGSPWVSLKRMCENLEVDVEGQRRKLKDKPWANLTTIQTVAADGKRYDTTMIDLDTIPGFLFSIDANKVAPSARKKLTVYQCEAAKVLAEHFKQALAATAAATQAVAAPVTAEVEVTPLPPVAPPTPPQPAPAPDMTTALAVPALPEPRPTDAECFDCSVADLARDITILRRLTTRLTNRLKIIEHWMATEAPYHADMIENSRRNDNDNCYRLDLLEVKVFGVKSSDKPPNRKPLNIELR